MWGRVRRWLTRVIAGRRLGVILVSAVAIGLVALSLLWQAGLPGRLATSPHTSAVSATPTLTTVPLASLPQSIPPEVASARLIGPHDPTDTLPFTLLIQPNNVVDLNHLLQEQYDPSGAQYHHWLQPGAFSREYGPTAAQMKAVTAFLGQHHLHTDQSSGTLAVTGTGLTADLEAAFGTLINDYQLDGTQFFANSANIQIPATLEPAVAGVSINSVPVMKSQMATTPLNYDPCAQSDCLDPSAIRTVYDANPVYTIHDQGQGQTLAVIEFSQYSQSDIQVYEKRYGLPNVTISNVTLAVPSTTFDHRYASEVEMDIELAIALAPGLQRIVVYQAPNTDAADVVMYDRIAADDTAEEVSTSWGDCEANQPAWIASAEYYALVQMAAQGQTVLAASGDAGAFSCLGDKQLAKQPMPQALQVMDPASQPWVTAVGGTSLAGAGAANAQGYPVGHEHSWNDDCASSACPGSGGGGVSRLWTLSDIGVQSGSGVIENGFSQYGAWCHAKANSFCREVPDVSMNADIYSPYWVYCADKGDTICGGWITVGGTSAAAPLWAAIVALMRQHGEFAGGLLTPLLYSFDSTHGYCFQLHDITQGTNGYYRAGAGYDMATGLGSPDIWFLVEQHQIGSGCPHNPAPSPTPTPKPAPGPTSRVTQYFLPAGVQAQSITRGPDGALWFTTFTKPGSNNQIGRISTLGHITLYTLPDQSSWATSITSGSDGALWFTDESVDRVGRITTTGQITEYSVATSASNQPDSITRGPDGALWFTYAGGGHTIGRITTTGQVSEYPLPAGYTGAFDIATGPDGNLWFTNLLQEASGTFAATIGRMTTSGQVTEYPLPSPNSNPLGLTPGPDGALWFIDFSHIGRITTSGQVSEYAPLEAPGLYITAGPDGALWYTGSGLGRINTAGTSTVYSLPQNGNPDGIVTGPDGALWIADGSNVTRFAP